MCDEHCTPNISSTKKRDLSSPEDQNEVKKNRLGSNSSDNCDFILPNITTDMYSPTSQPPTSLSLDQTAITSIASALKGSIQSEVCDMLKSTIDSIVQGVVAGLQSQINKLQTENEKLKTVNANLAHRVDFLEFKADESEQYSRRDNLRITGIVEKEDDNTDHQVLDMAKAIGSTLSLRDIAVSHRLGKKRVNGKPRDIIVKFNSRRDRDMFYKNRVLLKTNGYEGKFVNEDLTQYRSGVLYEARQLVRQKKIVGAWSTNCKLFVKVIKDKKTSVHTVTCKRDLEPFLSYTIE